MGKSTAARLFAQALNCEFDASKAPCGACRSCSLIERGNHPDVRTVTIGIDSDGKRRSEISIDQIRHNPNKPREYPPPVIQDAHLKPALGRHKVYIIDPADRMTDEASNSLLKLLEEPPRQVVLVLVTSEPSSLLPTVLSRCQHILFHLVGIADVEKALRMLDVDADSVAPLARLSGGQIAWAIRVAQQPEVLSVRRSLLELCTEIDALIIQRGLRLAEAIKLHAARVVLDSDGSANEVSDDETTSSIIAAAGDRALRSTLPWCLDVMVSWYRDTLAFQHSVQLLNPDFEADMPREPIPAVGEVEYAIHRILETKRAIQRNANIDLTLESLAIDLIGGLRGDES